MTKFNKILSALGVLALAFILSAGSAEAVSILNASQLSTTTTPGFVFQSNGPNAPGSFVSTTTLGFSGGGGTNFWTSLAGNIFNNTGARVQFPVFDATSTTGTSTITNALSIGGTSTLAEPYLLISTTAPAYGYLKGDLVDAGISANDYAAINTFNNGTGNCAQDGFIANNNSPSITAGFVDFMETNDGWTGVGCNLISPSNVNPDSGYTYNPSWDLDQVLGTTSPSVNGVPIGFKWLTANGATQAMVLTNAGNLGIGTSTPGSLLSLAGIANFTTATSTFYSTGGANITNGCYAVNGVCIGAGTSITGTQGQNVIIGPAGTAIATSSLFIVPNGNVGIGTTSPGNLLSIQGTTEPQFDIGFDTTNSASFDTNSAGLLTIFPTGGTTIINSILKINGQFQTSNANGMTASNLGTGAVSGSGITNTTVAQLRPNGSSAMDFHVLMRGSSVDTITANSSYSNLDIGNTSVTLPTTGTAPLVASEVLLPVAATAGGPATTTLAATFYDDGPETGTGAPTANYASYIRTGTSFFGGLVGIGVAAPTNALDVAGFINTDQFSGYKQAGNIILYASSTNSSLSIGGGGLPLFNTSATPMFSLAIGSGALTSATLTGTSNSAIGLNALQKDTTGNNNLSIGVNTLQNDLGGSFNSAIGNGALQANTTGASNCAQGTGALQANTTGGNNCAIGVNAFLSSITGSQNVGIGNSAGKNNGSATSTVFIGFQAGQGAAAYNDQGTVAIGNMAGFNLGTNSDYNLLAGYEAGNLLTTGAGNIILGAASTTANDNLTTGYGNIKIGNNISLPSATGSGQLDIGNLIYGTGLNGTGSTLSTGNIGIGTTTPYGELGLNAPAGTAPYFVIGSSTEVFKVTPSATATLGVGTSTPWQPISFSGGGAWQGLAAANSGNDTVCINPTTFQLFIGGSATNCAVSSARYKNTIATSTVGIKELMKLTPVTFFYDNAKTGGDPFQQLGFIAETVYKIDPRLVQLGTDGKPQSLKLDNFISLIVKSVQDIANHQSVQDKEIAQLQAQVKQLEAEQRN